MKVLINPLLILTMLVLAFAVYGNSVFAEECQVAYPMMEVIKCEKADAIQDIKQFSCDGSDCQVSYTCISDCTIDVLVDCGIISEIRGKVYKNGEELYDLSQFISGSGKAEKRGIRLGDGDNLLVTASCARLFIPYPVDTEKSKVSVHDYNKYFYATNHEWSSHKLSNTQNCIAQERASQFLGDQIKSGNLPSVYETGGTDILGNTIEIHDSDYNLKQISLTSEMKVGDTVSYFYRWETVPSINLKYDEDKTPVYCGSKKLLFMSEIETDGGNCYLIPSSLKKQVECCNDGDCLLTGEICGPGFDCTDKKPCNSDIECGIQEALCSNNIKKWWICDSSEGEVNLPNGEFYSGWCKQQTKNVMCCPNSCPQDQHCEEATGCVSNVRLIDCPAGKCCSEGGDYKPQTCASGLQCCKPTYSFIGECKETCEPEPEDGGGTSPGPGGDGLGTGGDMTGMFIVGGSIAGIVAVVIILLLVFKKPFRSKSKDEDIDIESEDDIADI